MRTVQGKAIHEIERESFDRLRERYEWVLVDVGTGDGRFVYEHARAHPTTLCIGLDPVAENLARFFARTNRKPSRGGVPNMLFVVASIEALPEALAGTADGITVHFPWGALLRGLVRPEPAVLEGLGLLSRRPGRLTVLLNAFLMESARERDRLDLPEISIDHVDRHLGPVYARHGLVLLGCEALGPGPLPVRTTWGQHLSLNSARKTLRLTIEIP